MAQDAKLLIRALTEENPYHEPAGSPIGGQFAHAPVRGTSATMEAPKGVTINVQTSPSGDYQIRGQLAPGALSDFKDHVRSVSQEHIISTYKLKDSDEFITADFTVKKWSPLSGNGTRYYLNVVDSNGPITKQQLRDMKIWVDGETGKIVQQGELKRVPAQLVAGALKQFSTKLSEENIVKPRAPADKLIDYQVDNIIGRASMFSTMMSLYGKHPDTNSLRVAKSTFADHIRMINSGKEELRALGKQTGKNVDDQLASLEKYKATLTKQYKDWLGSLKK
jgi:hypothetical protein